MIKTNTKYNPYKKVLAVVLAFVLVFSMATPGFAAYAEDGGYGDNGVYGEGAADEQTATPSDLPTTETITTSPAALTTGYIGITPYNITINIADLIAAGVNAGSVAEGWVFFAASNLINVQNANPLTFTGGTPENMLDAEIVINGLITSTANITIENLHLNRVSTGTPIAVVQGASLNLTISATNTLQNGGVGGAGLSVGGVNTLTIDGSGSLTARGHGLGAGIGGAGGSSGGNITILPTFNGTINAYGGANGGAGIGGGSGGGGGNVTIGGGAINATGGGTAPGIGAGQGNSNHGTLNVTGGTVTVDGVIANGNIINMSNPNPPTSGTGWTFNPATNRYTVTGNVTIRGDNGTSNRTILVSGSPTLTLDDVTVTVSTIGIHGSPLETGTGNVTLNLVDGTTNSFVSTAAGGTEGISPGSTGNLTINGTGTLVAMGTGNGAGIGFQGVNNLGHITINSGTVIATGGPTGPGFGNASITINGGNVTANGNGGQPGFRATGDNITVNPAAVINSTPRPQITFDTDGGTAVSPQDVGTGNRLANFPANPTRGTDTFSGWWDTSAATGGNQITAGPNGTVFPNNATIYARWTAAPSATIGNVTIGNAGGDVVITIANAGFVPAIPNINSWITNLPAGMTQHANRTGPTVVTITVSGTPTATSTEQIAVTIPANSFGFGSAPLMVTANSNVVFNTIAADTPITTAQITVTEPATGATPNTTATIDSGTGFTAGNVSWTALGTAAGSTFLGDRQYTATVTLTATTGNTFTGLAAGSNVTINGFNATITNNIGTAVTLSYQFASTAPAPINSAAINVTAPVMGATRNTTATGTGNFNISAVTWTPSAGATFAPDTAYTAIVTLTAHAGHTFPTGFAGTINGHTATVNVTLPGTNANVVTLSWTFPQTEAAPVAPTITSGTPPNGTVATVYNFTFTATGSDPITWDVSSGSLPGGLSLSAGGVLSGTPTTAGIATFTVRATNAVNNDTQSHTITIGTAATAPSVPLNLTSVRGNGQVALSWDIPASNGGSAILHYEVQVGTGAWANVSNVTSHTVTGLTNGTTYTFNVRAVNVQGNSPNATTTATPATVPSAPQTFTATAGDAQVVLNWTAPSSNGGSAITSYQVSSDGGTTWVAATSNTGHTFTGLTNGTAYNFAVRAVNDVGNGTSATATATPVAPLASDNDITAFTIPGQVSSGIVGTAITVTMPHGTNVTNLVPTITHTGASISPASGVAQDFTSPVTYTVTAADNSTQVYTVTVNVAAPITHTITYNPNNGTGTMASGTVVNGGNYTISANTFTRANHNFTGWNTQAGGGGTAFAAGATITNVTANITLFAQWQYTGTPSTGGNGGSSDPGPSPGWLSPSSTDFNLASPRNLVINLNRGDFTFQNAIWLGNVNTGIPLIRDADFTISGNTITIMADFLAENLEVGTRTLRFVMSGNRTLNFNIRVTDTRPTATPDLPNDEAPAMPIVQVDLSPALTAELQERLGDRFNDLEIIVNYDIAQTTPQGVAMGDIHGFWDVIVEFIVRGDSADGSDDEIITDFVNHYYLSADMSNFYLGNLNHHRITALNTTSNEYRQYGYIGSIVGGNVVFDPVVDIETDTPTEIATFALQSNHTGGFMITYVRNLIRLDLSLNSPAITDLAGNAPTTTMDVLPFIQDNRTLIPIRFIGDALGADIDWSNATDDRPLTVHLTLNGQTLSFGIGEITPELAALGMDVPAQLMGNRTMVPLRFVSEFFGAVVNWDDETRGIEIIYLPTTAINPATSNSTNPNHNPNTGIGDNTALALTREDEDESNEQS